jgi:GT2 family glycosyltransferase
MRDDSSVAIIILNWNGFNDSVECLNSLRTVTYRNYQIVLVDNGSLNDEGFRLKEMFPEVHLINNLINRGFAGGNNDGINWALEQGSDYIVNLNNDCLVGKDWLSELIDGVKISKADFASSRIMYYPETNLICSDGDGLLPDGEGVVENHLRSPVTCDEIKPIFSACGAGSIFSASCLQGVKIHRNQFYDELYFAYLEDLDLGIRLNVKNYRGVLVPDAVVYHKGSQSAGFHSYFQIFQLEKNRILNVVLNYPLWLIPAGEAYYIFRTLLHNIKRILLRRKYKQQRDIKPTESYSALSVMLKSRLWVVHNLPKVWNDRKERKRRGMINRKIIGYFYWDCPNLKKIKKNWDNLLQR